MNPRCILPGVLRDPSSATTLTLSGWDDLVRQARTANLLARLHVVLEQQQLLDRVPAPPRTHLEAARTVAEQQKAAVEWEVRCVDRALARLAVPYIVLLKGGAYHMARLPAARGRIFSDLDILVPKPQLLTAEKHLMMAGWQSTHHDTYDQRYYRQWMHELPPLQHIKRETVLDVHHNILPETARQHPDPERLFAAAVPVAGFERLRVLAPCDMVLHSACHLFSEGEMDNSLRDLVDLDALLRHFSRDEGFWTALLARARDMDLTRSLYYALRYSQRLLGTPVPAGVQQQARSGGPPGPIAAFMDALFLRALAPDHQMCNTRFTRPARRMLYLRSHYLRMPLYLLIPHLLRKALIHPAERKQDDAAPGVLNKRP